ncbi:MAG: acylase [Aureispira sp.]|nr:acylase [Aureispira sp.]
MKLSQILVFLIFPLLLNAQNAFPKIDPNNITIVRDIWGVPHIYGHTDEEAAYGLAWAHSEDDFHTIQESLLAINGRLAEVKGKEGAIQDMLAFIANVQEVVDDQFEEAFSEQFKKVLDGYVQGINKYAIENPKEVLRKGIFPIEGKDIIKGYTLALTLMSNVHYDIARIFGNNVLTKKDNVMARGSNGFAFNRFKTKENEVFIAINSHQPLRGTYSWYEAHVNSNEGWNALGGVLPGGVSIFLGSTPNLAWAHTINYPDMHDVYQLTMHPKNKLIYKFDGEWFKLEKRKITVKVKLGAIRIPVTKTFYWSKYGTTIKNKEGFFAVRFPANMKIKAAEQWYWMNKATNFQTFKKALEIQGAAGLNTVYADKEDNIYFLSNVLAPYRNPNYNWKGLLPGDTSATLWEPPFMPLDSLVQLHNPDCGYVFNANNSPFDATSPYCNADSLCYNTTIGYQLLNTTRAIRFGELMDEYELLSYTDFKRIKNDLKFPKYIYTRTAQNLEDLLHMDSQKYPDLKDLIEHLNKWDRTTKTNNRQAAIMSLAINYLLGYSRKRGIVDVNKKIPEAVLIDALRFAKKHLLKHFKTIDIELGQLQVHVRGKKELPMWGLPENIAQMYTTKYKKGKYQSFLGESYIQLVRFDKEGPHIESIHCYGASNHEGHRHYNDQMEIFLQQKLKKMTLDKESIFYNAEQEYHPK